MTWPGKFWDTQGHFRTNFTREMGPDNNGMNTLFRSPLVVAYTTGSHQNKGPFYCLVISARCTVTHIRSIRRTSYPHTVELHLSAAFEEHAQISTSDRALHEYGWIFEPANSVLCREKKKICVQQACTSCDTSPCITCRGSVCHSEWPEPCSTSSTPYVTMPFDRRSRAHVLSFTDFIFEIFLIPLHHVH